MVLIGSGSGNLSIEDTVASLVRSLDVAVRERELTGRLETIVVVEQELGKAWRPSGIWRRCHGTVTP